MVDSQLLQLLFDRAVGHLRMREVDEIVELVTATSDDASPVCPLSNASFNRKKRGGAAKIMNCYGILLRMNG